jgi:hypothetical protein
MIADSPARTADPDPAGRTAAPEDSSCDGDDTSSDGEDVGYDGEDVRSTPPKRQRRRRNGEGGD